ncbi:MAG: lmo0937 family membrane protein [Bacteroidota bacterium]
MGSSLGIIAAVLFIAWLVGFFGYNAGQNVHILLLLSIILVLIKMLVLVPDKERT